MQSQERQKKKQLDQYNKIEMMQPKTAEFPEPRKVTINADKRSEYEKKGYKYIGRKDVEIKAPALKKTKKTQGTKDAAQVVTTVKKEDFVYKNMEINAMKLTKQYLVQLIQEVISEQKTNKNITDILRKYNFKLIKSERVTDIYSSYIGPIRIVVGYNKNKTAPTFFEYQVISPVYKRILNRISFKTFNDLEAYIKKTDF